MSFDYGILQKTRDCVCIEADLEWDDVGDFVSLSRIIKPDKNGNVIVGSFEGVAKQSIIVSKFRTTMTKGIENLIIVDTPDVTLICDKNQGQEIKKMVMLVNETDLEQYTQDLVAKPQARVLSISSEGCEVKSDGLVAVICADDLIITRDETTLRVEQG